jgi:hypothetical protein
MSVSTIVVAINAKLLKLKDPDEEVSDAKKKGNRA